MPKKTISQLKSAFVTGARPGQGNFGDVFDSFVHKDDVATVNQSSIGTAIQQYDSQLKSQTSDGVVNTLGDVFRVFQGFNDQAKVVDVVNDLREKAKWGGLPDKPNNIALTWTEQTITMQSLWTSSYNPVVALSSLPRNIRAALPLNTSATIADIHYFRFRVALAAGDSIEGQNSMMIYSPFSVTLAVQPKTIL
jgi:hypothetical protein